MGRCPNPHLGNSDGTPPSCWRLPGAARVTLPRSVETIDGTAFIRCDAFVSFTIAAENPTYYAKDGCIIEKATGYRYAYYWVQLFG